MKLKIYSDKIFLPAGVPHVTMLYPFWGKNPEDNRDPSSGRFDVYSDVGVDYFEMTSLHDADFAVLPMDWGHVTSHKECETKATQLIKQARNAGKRIIIFFWNDSEAPIRGDDVMIFRTSLYQHNVQENEFAMPAWSEDLLTKYSKNKLSVQKKRKKPVIGFCGYAPTLTIRRKIKRFLFSNLKKSYSDATVRQLALNYLKQSTDVETNFVIRDQFLGGSLDNNGKTDYNALQRTRSDFVQNIFDSDYVLCSRGAGNYSYRLYETLCAGRIPVFVNTDCVLPYEQIIDWKQYCVWVEESEVDNIAQIVAEFHNKLTEEEFETLQKKCRQLWEEYLSPVGFFKNFHRHFSYIPIRSTVKISPNTHD